MLANVLRGLLSSAQQLCGKSINKQPLYVGECRRLTKLEDRKFASIIASGA